MHRLGVAAMGMFNRRSLHILTEQLSKDVAFFGLTRDVEEPLGGVAMSQADLLLGSFFFIHESKNRRSGSQLEQEDEARAFEFLHNTFGEFLTADFILRAIFAETGNLADHELSSGLKAQMGVSLARPDAFPATWYACVMWTPLYTRPVVLSMLREWFEHSLARAGRTEGEVLGHFDTIVGNQIKRILTEDELPEVMGKEAKTPFGTMGRLGHIATYSLNLLVLRTVLGRNEYEFDEDKIGEYEEGARPWDRLTHLWRSWFSLDSLRGLPAIWTARREGRKVVLRAREDFGAPSGTDRLESVRRVSLALADDIGAGLAGLAAFGRVGRDREAIERIGALLEAEGIDVRVELLLRQLQSPVRRFMGYEERLRMFDTAWQACRESDASEGQLMELLSVAEEEGIRAGGLRELERTLAGRGRELFVSAEMAVVFWRLATRAGVERWYGRFDGEHGERLLSRVFDPDWETWRGGGLVEVIQLARGNRGARSVERFAAEFFRRSPRETLVLKELGPGGVGEVLRFAGEMGEIEWFSQGLREVRAWLEEMRETDVDPHGAAALFAGVKAVASECGEEELFERELGGIERKIWSSGGVGSGRKRWHEAFLEHEALREATRSGTWVRSPVEEMGPRALYEIRRASASPDYSWRP